MYDKIHIQVSIAVLVIDDFTDKIVTSSALRVAVSSGKKPVKKEGGFYVFTNLTDSVVQVTVNGPGYCPQVQSVDLESLDLADPIVRIRMKPDRTYILSEKDIRVLAFLPSGATLFLLDEEGGNYKRLLADYESGSDEISLYRSGTEELAEKICCIVDKNQQYEMIRLGVLKEREAGIYSLRQEPRFSYKKVDTKIYPVSSIGGESEREYFLPLQGDGREEIDYTCILQQEEGITLTHVTLRRGRENRLDFRGNSKKEREEQ